MSWCSRKKPASPSLSIIRSSSSRRPTQPRASARRRRSARAAARGTAPAGCARRPRPRSRGSGSRGRAEVERELLGEPARLAHRLGMVAKAAGHRRGPGDHVAVVTAAQRRRGVQGAWWRTATNASAVRRAGARVCMDVAGRDAWHRRGAAPGRRARRLRARSSRRNGRWSSTRRRLGARTPRATAGSVGSSLHATQGAAAEADKAVGMPENLGETTCAGHGGAGGPCSLASMHVCAREQAAQARPPPAAFSTSRVRWRPSSRSTSAPWIARKPSEQGADRELHRARERIVIGQRQCAISRVQRSRDEIIG